jgi:hypothetical protein
MLAQVIRRHWLALVRDVLALGFRASDMFTKLNFLDMLAITVCAPPQSAVRMSLDGGWSKEAHILANLAEGNAGLARMSEPYQRPGIDERQPDPMTDKWFHADAYTWDEFDELERQRYSEENKPRGKNHVRTL